MNCVNLVGRLTAAPELKKTQNGTSVTAVTIAVDRRIQPKDGEKVTDFINCVAWQGTAEFITRYFKKGDPIAVTGEIQTRKYTDKDGNNRVAVEVKIDNARFVPSKANSTEEAQPASNIFDNTSGGDFGSISNDDLPF